MMDGYELLMAWEAMKTAGVGLPQRTALLHLKARIHRGLVTEETYASSHLRWLRWLAEREHRVLGAPTVETRPGTIPPP